MENALRQIKTQKSLNSNNELPEGYKGALYSPLIHGHQGSAQDNAHIMGSEKTGTTPGQLGSLARQISNGPAIISGVNPINEELREKALKNPAVEKNDPNAAAL
jgi:hypothetical protein